MELFKYIIKFIYHIRWWMVIFPCILEYHKRGSLPEVWKKRLM